MTTIIVKEPGAEPQVLELQGPPSLEQLQDLVGGYIEKGPLPPPLAEAGIVCLVDEEGKLRNLEPNFTVSYRGHPVHTVGTAVFVASDRGDPSEMIGLTDTQQREVTDFLELVTFMATDFEAITSAAEMIVEGDSDTHLVESAFDARVDVERARLEREFFNLSDGQKLIRATFRQNAYAEVSRDFGRLMAHMRNSGRNVDARVITVALTLLFDGRGKAAFLMCDDLEKNS